MRFRLAQQFRRVNIVRVQTCELFQTGQVILFFRLRGTRCLLSGLLLLACQCLCVTLSGTLCRERQLFLAGADRLRVGGVHRGGGAQQTGQAQALHAALGVLDLGCGEFLHGQVGVRGRLGGRRIRERNVREGRFCNRSVHNRHFNSRSLHRLSRSSGFSSRTEAGAVRGFTALLVGARGTVRQGIRLLIERVTRVALHPNKLVVAAGQRLIQRLQKVAVEHGLAVGFLPALLLPAGHPLGQRVNDVLAIAVHAQLCLRAGCGRFEQVQDSLKLTHIVGAVRPAAARPVVVVDIPCPARRSGVAQRRAVCGGNDFLRAVHGTFFLSCHPSSVQAAVRNDVCDDFTAPAARVRSARSPLWTTSSSLGRAHCRDAGRVH